MKQFCFLVLCMVWPVTLFAGLEEKRMTIAGSAEILARADTASFSFEVMGQGPNLFQAVDQARGKVSKISEALFKAGLKKENLRTSLFHSGENSGNKSFLSSEKDYQANLTVIVSLDDLNLLETAIITVSGAKPEKLSDISFSLKSYEKLRMEALEKAVLKAKEKATLLSQIMNFKLGDVIAIDAKESIAENNPGVRNRHPASLSASNVVLKSKSAIGNTDGHIVSEAAGAGFFARQFRITAKVTATIEILGNSEKPCAGKPKENQAKVKAVIEIEGQTGQ